MWADSVQFFRGRQRVVERKQESFIKNGLAKKLLTTFILILYRTKRRESNFLLFKECEYTSNLFIKYGLEVNLLNISFENV